MSNKQPEVQPQEPKRGDTLIHAFILVSLVALSYAFTQLANLNSYSNSQREQMRELQTEYRGYQNGVKDGR